MTGDNLVVDELRTDPARSRAIIKPVADFATTDVFTVLYQGLIGGTDNITCYFVETGGQGFDYEIRTHWDTKRDAFPTTGYYLEKSNSVAGNGQDAHTPLKKIGLIQIMVKSSNAGQAATIQAGLVAG